MDLPKKTLGQHWLEDRDTLSAICDLAQIKANDAVLEIGPGLGSLTELLIERSDKVTAVELDEDLINSLKEKFKDRTNLQIVNKDIRRFNLDTLPKGYKVVANIPYYLSSYLIRLLSESSNQPQSAVLLVQKEVAQRLAAAPGKLSLLGVIAQTYWQVELGDIVKAAMFTPAPKVDSQIVKLSRRPAPLFPEGLEKEYLKLVKAGFSQKRKTLVNNLSRSLHISKENAHSLIKPLGLKVFVRAQELSVAQWSELVLAINSPHLIF